MADQVGDELAGLQVPYLDGVISATRGHNLSIWRHCHRVDCSFVTPKRSRWVIATEIFHVIPLKTTQIFRASFWLVCRQQVFRADNVPSFECVVSEVHVRHVEQSLIDFFLPRNLPLLPE